MRDRTARVLFVTPVLQHPPHGGPSLRVENSIKALSRISDLYLYSRVSLADLGGAKALVFYKQYCKGLYFAPFCRPTSKILWIGKRAINFAARRTINRAIFTRDQESSRDFHHVIEVADAIKADVIWLGYGNISYPLLEYVKRRSIHRVVLDTDSIWSRYVLRGVPFAKGEEERQRIERVGREKEVEERWGTQLADVTTAVSETDAEYYRGLAQDPRRVHIFSNVVDVESYCNSPPPAPNFQKPSVYLAGTFMRGRPMEDAARWVIQGILPLARRRIPDLHLYIVGRGSDEVLPDIQDPRITITGQVPSVLPYLCHAGVAVVPLRFESGTRFKILEAGACGIPVVSTTLGAEGLPITHGVDLLIADDPESFAQSIITLIKERDLAIRMGENLKALVHKRYTIESLVEEGRVILEYMRRSC